MVSASTDYIFFEKYNTITFDIRIKKQFIFNNSSLHSCSSCVGSAVRFVLLVSPLMFYISLNLGTEMANKNVFVEPCLLQFGHMVFNHYTAHKPNHNSFSFYWPILKSSYWHAHSIHTRKLCQLACFGADKIFVRVFLLWILLKCSRNRVSQQKE